MNSIKRIIASVMALCLLIMGTYNVEVAAAGRDQLNNWKNQYDKWLQHEKDVNADRIIIKYKDDKQFSESTEGVVSYVQGTTESVAVESHFSSKDMKDFLKDNYKNKEFEIEKEFRKFDVEIIKLDEGVDVEDFIAKLEASGMVEYAQPDYKLFSMEEVTLDPTATDAYYDMQWALYPDNSKENINVEGAWSQLSDNTLRPVVGVLDTGIDVNHPELQNNIYVNIGEIPNNNIDDDGNGYIDDVNGYDFYNADNSVYDNAIYDKHGTHVAGIIASNKNQGNVVGVAPEAIVLPLKFIENGYGYTSDAIEAIAYADAMGVDIINASFGTSEYNNALYECMASTDILFVTAAGNDNKELTDTDGIYPAGYNLPNVISVGAHNSIGAKASFSNYGQKVDVTAPGTDIYGIIPNGQYEMISGTSQATPHVAGIAALLKQQYSDMTPVEMAERIKNNTNEQSTEPVTATANSKYGSVNAAYTMVGDAGVYNPPIDEPVEEPIGTDGDSLVSLMSAEVSPELLEQIHFGEEGVSAATGNYSTKRTDFSMETLGFTLNISRTYNSKDIGSDSGFGKGWTFGFEGSIEQDDTNSSLWKVNMPDGSVDMFTLSANVYEPVLTRSVLEKQSDETHILTTKDQYTYGFDTNGYLNWMKDRNGNQITIFVDASGKVSSVKDSSNREFVIDYEGGPVIRTITDELGRVYSYDYTTENRLETVTNPEGITEKYTYTSDGYLDIIQNHDLKVLMDLEYYPLVGEQTIRRVKFLTDSVGVETTYNYIDGQYKTLITDQYGKQITKEFNTSWFLMKTIDPMSFVIEADYNEFGEEKFIIDRYGNKTDYSDRDAQGNILTVVNPDGTTKSFTYDGFNNMTSETDENGNITFYEYDELLLMEKVVPLDGTTKYDGILDRNLFAITTYSYYENGLLKETINAEGLSTIYDYNKHGYISSETVGGISTTTYTYNDMGWLLSKISPEGYKTSYEYNYMGQKVKEISDDGSVNRYGYDKYGRLEFYVTAENYNASDTFTHLDINDDYIGAKDVQYFYDSDGLLDYELDINDVEIDYEYDKYGRLLTETYTNGESYKYEYDLLDRITGKLYHDSSMPVDDYYYIYKEDYSDPTATIKEVTHTSFQEEVLGLEKQPDPEPPRYIDYTTPVDIMDISDGSHDGLYAANRALTYLDNGWLIFARFNGANSSDKFIEYFYSDDYGLNWYLLTTTDVAGDRGLSLASKGNKVYCVYGDSGYSYLDVFDATLDNITHSKNRVFFPENYGYYFHPDIEIDNTGKVHVAIYFSDNDWSYYRVRYGCTTDNGLTWENVRNSDDKYDYFEELDLVLDKNNLPIVMTCSKLDGGGEVMDILHMTSGNEDVRLGSYNGGNTVSADILSDGTIVCVWRAKIPFKSYEIFFSESMDNGVTWSEPVAISGATGYCNPSLSRDADDNVHVVAGTYEDDMYLFSRVNNVWKSKELLTTSGISGNTFASTIKDMREYEKPLTIWINRNNNKIVFYGKWDEEIYGTPEPVITDTEEMLNARIEAAEKAISSKTYDDRGRVASEVDANGGVTTYTYTDSGMLSKVVLADGGEVNYKYDAFNNIVAEWTLVNGTDYSYKGYVYNKVGQITESRIGKDNVALFEIPATDRMITTISTYNELGLLVSVSNADGSLVEYVYDLQGRVIEEKTKVNDTETQVLIYSYDHNGQLLTTTMNVSAQDLANESTGFIELVSTTEYNKDGNVIKTTSADGQVTTYKYYSDGSLENVTTQSVVDGNMLKDLTLHTDYDNMGRVTSISNHIGTDDTAMKTGTILTYTYGEKGLTLTETVTPVDASGNPISIDARTIAYAYDFAGRLTTSVSPEHFEKQTNFDVSWEEHLRTLTHTAYTYDDNGNLLTETDHYTDTHTGLADSITRGYTYDDMGRLLTSTDGMGNVTKYTYDKQGRVITTQSQGTRDLGYSYDVKNTYDGAGRLVKETNALGTSTIYEYDNNSNVLSTGVQKSGSAAVEILSTMTYDNANQMISQTNGNGNTTYYDYNLLGQPRTVILPYDETIGGITTSYVYTIGGQVAEESTSEGAKITYDYFSDGMLAYRTSYSSEGIDSITENYTYDIHGNVITMTNAEGYTTTYTYDGFGQLDTEQLENHVIDYDYDVAGRLETTTNKILGNDDLSANDDIITSFENVYDDLGRLYKQIDAKGNAVATKLYNDNHQQVKDIVENFDENGILVDCITEFQYDGNNRVIKTIDAKGNVVTNEYNAIGQISRTIDPESNVTTYSYDYLGRLEAVTNALNQTTRYTYDTLGNLTSQTDGNGHTTIYEYNSRGLMTRFIEHGGRFDGAYGYEYDNSKIESYTYNPDGTMASKTDRNGYTTIFSYDGFMRLTEENVEDDFRRFSYDDLGNVLTVNDETGVTSRVYDAFGRVTLKSVPDVGVMTFTYDGKTTGNYTQQTTVDQQGNITIETYDENGRLYQVEDGNVGGGILERYHYDKAGNKFSITKGDTEILLTEYKYFKNNQLEELINYDGTVGQAVISKYNYEYDDAGNQTKKVALEDDENGTSISSTTKYEYDALNRLYSVTETIGVSSDVVTTYKYDGAGNRLAEIVTGKSDPADNKDVMYKYDERNRLLSTESTADGKIDTVTMVYDNNGNMLSSTKESLSKITEDPMTLKPSFGMFVVGQKAEGEDDTLKESYASYSYDHFNQMVSAKNGDTISTYMYNGEGYRTVTNVNGKTTQYVYVYDKVVLEIEDDYVSSQRNVYGQNKLIMRSVDKYTGSAMDVQDSYYYYYNGHGDVTALLNLAYNNVAARYDYDAFGNITKNTNEDLDNPILYSGYQYDDETGLYYLNARMYDPEIARFMQMDTYLGKNSDPLSLNLYTYCANNPIRYWDPTGHRYVADVDADVVIAPITSNATLKVGSTGAEVKIIQKQLIDNGYDIGGAGADGVFGQDTLKAVLQMQADAGLKADGLVGNQTKGALNLLKANNGSSTIDTDVIERVDAKKSYVEKQIEIMNDLDKSTGSRSSTPYTPTVTPSKDTDKIDGTNTSSTDLTKNVNDSLQNTVKPAVDAFNVVASGVGNGIEDAKHFFKYSTLDVMENVGRSPLVKRRFVDSVDAFLPWSKGLSRASGGVDLAGDLLDIVDTSAHIYIDLVDNYENGASTEEFLGDALGELTLYGLNRSTDTLASAVGLFAGGAVGGLVGSSSPDPATTIGGAGVAGSVGKYSLPAIVGFTIGHYVDKTYSNGLTGRETIKVGIKNMLEGK